MGKFKIVQIEMDKNGRQLSVNKRKAIDRSQKMEVLKFTDVIEQPKFCFDVKVGGYLKVLTRQEILDYDPIKLVEFYEKNLHIWVNKEQ